MTSVISFRCHKNVAAWLRWASEGLQKGELLRLILTGRAYQQASDNPLSALLERMLSRPSHDWGNSIVLGVRLPQETASLIKDCATRRKRTVSEWCGLVLADWADGFIQLYKDNGERQGEWLTVYTSDLRANVADMAQGYAQKQTKQPSEVSL